MFRLRLAAFVVLATAVALPGIASAQDDGVATLKDVFWVNYFDNAGGSPDAKVRITNPGTSLTLERDTVVEVGNLCAMIYVFRPNQELSECCGCRVTPNGFLKLSVNEDLTNNPLHEGEHTQGVIKIVSSLPNGPDADHPCDPGGLLERVVPTPALRAWGTHVQDDGTHTETEFLPAALSGGEYLRLLADCAFIEGTVIPPGLGSGHGICHCPPEPTPSTDAGVDPPIVGTVKLPKLPALP